MFSCVLKPVCELINWVWYIIYTFLVVEKIPEFIRPDLSFELATLAHDKWWDNYRKNNPSTPRYKKLPDGTEIDINNCALNCPAWVKYQAELVHRDFVDAINLAATIDYNADMVHRIWMKKNDWERDTRPHLFVPFEKLTEEEKEKDRDIVRIILELITKSK
jgi:hypothetical protein